MTDNFSSFDKFAPLARQVVNHARQEAKWFKHEQVNSIHLLLGMLGVGTGAAPCVLQRKGVRRDQLRKEVGDLPLTVPGTRARARIHELEEDCYVCRRIDEYFGHLLENLVYIWSSDPEFREKFAAQPMFCLPHWEMMLGVAKAKLNKKDYYAFAKAASDVVLPYFDQLREDVSWFCKKFDYRYGDEPWYNSKDSVERAMAFLNSDIHRPPKKK